MTPASRDAPLHADVFVERSMRRWLEDVADGRHSGEAADCLQWYNVRFVERLVSQCGDRVFCHFLAPDAESVRAAMRGAGIVAEAVWVAAGRDGAARSGQPPTTVCFAADRTAVTDSHSTRPRRQPSRGRRYAARDGSRAIEIREGLPQH